MFHQISVFGMIVMHINKLRYPVKMKAKGGLRRVIGASGRSATTN